MQPLGILWSYPWLVNNRGLSADDPGNDAADISVNTKKHAGDVAGRDGK